MRTRAAKRRHVLPKNGTCRKFMSASALTLLTIQAFADDALLIATFCSRHRRAA
jgi:hypothetical protein